jgi:CRISPR/Cas system CSM-associated protein Csm3 (group 7 of RAMP superfamily)
MARKIYSRIKVAGTLVAESPLHVGGIGGNPEVDLALAVNGQGHYYIPGTSLAGAFRGWMQMNGDGCERLVNDLWGLQEQNGRNGHASFVLVEDAPIEGAVVEIRDGVGIDRVWGTAAERVKYDRAILPKASKIKLDLTLEVGSKLSKNWTEYQALFADLLNALKNGEIRLGAAKTRGLGRVKLQDLKVCQYDFLTHKGMLNTLRGYGDEVDLDALLNVDGATVSAQRPRLTIEIEWKPQGPLMVKAEGDGIAVDILPLVSAVDNSLRFVLPGSSIKGALRTQAERIVRTLLSLQASEDPNQNQRFIQQLDIPLVPDLFGSTAKTEEKTQLGNIGIGSLSVDDCYADLQMSPNAWGNIEAATNESNLRQALNNAGLRNTQHAFHVAVDRWTGGAADGFLYSTLEPMDVPWQPIRLTLDLTRLRKHQLPGISLLLLVLRDLTDSRIPLGYGTNRGMGAIKVIDVVINGRGLDDPLAALAGVTLSDGKLTIKSTELLDKLNHAWMQWLNTSAIGGT